jgi:hypothetical protein
MNYLLSRTTPRERVVLLVLAIYVTVAVVVLTPIRGALGGERQAQLPPPPAAAVPDQAAERAAPAPELAASDRLRAGEILGADRSLATALGGMSYSIVKAGAWTTSGADGAASRVLGAAFVVAPAKPIELRSAKLPGALYDQTERTNPPYQAVVNTVSAKQATQFMVLVDLERGKVVNITPGPDTQALETTPPPGFQRTVPAPREEGR